MNPKYNFGSISPVIRYSPDEIPGAAAATGFRNKGSCKSAPAKNSIA